jgi:hypothetical protein
LRKAEMVPSTGATTIHLVVEVVVAFTEVVVVEQTVSVLHPMEEARVAVAQV